MRDKYQMCGQNECVDIEDTPTSINMHRACKLLNEHHLIISRQSTASMRQAEQIAELEKESAMLHRGYIHYKEVSEQAEQGNKELTDEIVELKEGMVFERGAGTEKDKRIVMLEGQIRTLITERAKN